ncbi:MAG: hypothetical protein E6Q88_13335 [Lysobacteraceae bacterium]|nr:MAG: hypothetical protein E6Q88_13335 [Xanthomonadaceae bacterium]
MQSASRDDEQRALRKRRRIAGVDADQADPPKIGLALSGGGIRSATFCLGLLRGLAQNGLLTRFDYLSTVSGGGYIGAMFGRLVTSLGIHRAQAELARSDSLHLAWLRRYGRYLAPRGARDYGTAIATYMRAAIAVHVEFAFMALMLAALAVLPHVMQWQWGVFEQSVWQGWRSAWWPLALGFWSLCAPGALGVYWMLRDPPPDDAGRARRLWFRGFDLAVVIAAGIAGIALFATWIESLALPMHMPWWKWAVCLILIGLAGWGVWIQILLFRQRSRPGGVAIAITRNHLTRALRAVNAIAAGMLVLGLLDWTSWKLWAVLQKSQAGLFGGLGLGGALLLLLRNANEPLQKLAMPGDGSRPGMLSWLFDFAGFGLAFALVVLWTTLAQWWVFGEKSIIECILVDKFGWMASVCDTLNTTVAAVGAELRGGEGAATVRGVMFGADKDVLIAPGFAWLCMVAFLLLWFFGTGTNAESVNTSSLHNMYRARLVRAYFGSVNWRRFRGEREGRRGAGDPQDVSNINEVVEGDDVSLRKYRPASRGGPIHLIGVCLNQTRDHRSKLYNADRKGVPLAVSAYGMEIGSGEYPAIHPAHPGTLGRWVAISGAAASPGAGANTTPGWALLLFLAGARLGVWLEHGDTVLRRAVQSVGADASGPMRRFVEALRGHGEKWFAKYMRLHAEARAAYRGPRASSWYLSDGGHFDNTGVHALLRRELDFIVLADCGADPNYHFEDIENLVRKARIDFGADIEFYSREEATRRFRSGREIGFLSQE